MTELFVSGREFFAFDFVETTESSYRRQRVDLGVFGVLVACSVEVCFLKL